MKKNIKKTLGTILLIGCLSLSLAACNKTNAADTSSTFVSYEEVQDEFVQTCKNLNWPQGYEVPTEIDSEKDDSAYQIGFGNTRASLYWEAAWEREWLDSYKSDPERADQAIKELEKALSMPYMSEDKCDDATREIFKKYLDQAKNGDPSGFEENLRLNAPE